jgi:hypothetical protein
MNQYDKLSSTGLGVIATILVIKLLAVAPLTVKLGDGHSGSSISDSYLGHHCLP